MSIPIRNGSVDGNDLEGNDLALYIGLSSYLLVLDEQWGEQDVVSIQYDSEYCRGNTTIDGNIFGVFDVDLNQRRRRRRLDMMEDESELQMYVGKQLCQTQCPATATGIQLGAILSSGTLLFALLGTITRAKGQ